MSIGMAYHPAGSTCTINGEHVASAQYVSKYVDQSAFLPAPPEGQGRQEHLHKKCNRCGYEWIDDPLKKASPADA